MSPSPTPEAAAATRIEAFGRARCANRRRATFGIRPRRSTPRVRINERRSFIRCKIADCRPHTQYLFCSIAAAALTIFGDACPLPRRPTAHIIRRTHYAGKIEDARNLSEFRASFGLRCGRTRGRVFRRIASPACAVRRTVRVTLDQTSDPQIIARQRQRRAQNG